MKFEIINTPTKRIVRYEGFYHEFDKKTGYSETWGKTKEDDPDWCKVGPLLCDIEISTVCSRGCKACYKSNTSKGKNMSLRTFMLLVARLPKTIDQIAFGIGDIDTNPDLFDIFRLCRLIDIVPNVTINGTRMTTDFYNNLIRLCGAVAVSHYNDDECFNTIQTLTNGGLSQVNIHQILSEDTYGECIDLLLATKTDPRLKNLKAIVFLSLKEKGDRNCLKPLRDFKKYKQLIDLALKNKISIGFDSCGASNFLKAVEKHENFNRFKTLAEPCESTCFSLYINVDAKAFPCSFTEDQPGYNGVDIIGTNDFIKGVWNHPELQQFRNKLITGKDKHGCRTCPEFNLTMR